MTQPRHPLAYPDYRLFWIARIGSGLSENAMAVVIGWQVYDIARQTMGIRDASLQLGIVGLAQFLPLLALALVSGWVADRIDRRRIAQLTWTLRIACQLALAWMTLKGTITLPALFTVAAMLGVARSFGMPAMNALAPNLVPPAVLPRAIAMSSIAAHGGGILGPAMGGYLYAIAPHVPYFTSAGLLTVSLICLLFVRTKAKASGNHGHSPWKLMVQGLSYVRHNRIVLGAMSLDLFAVLLGGATAMLPVFAYDILHVGPTGLGHLRAAPAAGAVLMAIIFSQWPLRRKVGRRMLEAVAIFGVATVVFGLSRNVWLSLGCLFLLGAADMFSVFVRQSLVQITTPDAMRGRVSAVSSLFISASNELGEAESGFLAAAIGPVATVVIGGIGTIFIAIFWSRMFPALRDAHDFDSIEPVMPNVTLAKADRPPP